MAMRGSGGRAAAPMATSWDKLSARDHGETLENRDVYNNQQLDRSKIAIKRSKKPSLIAATITGVVVAMVAWILYSAIALAVTSLTTAIGSMGGVQGTSAPGKYYIEDIRSGPGGVPQTCYRALDERGRPAMTCMSELKDVPVPSWYTEAKKQADSAKAQESGSASSGSAQTLGAQLVSVSSMKLFFSFGSGLLISVIVGSWFVRRIDAANLMSDTSDINQYENDQHIALPEEIQRRFDWFPDAGAHSAVQVSSVISHNMLQKKGLGDVRVTKRADKDVYDTDGTLVYYKGEVMQDESGETIVEIKPMIDEQFGDDLFEASGLPKVKALRKKYDTTVIPYNSDGKDRDKLGAYKTVSDLIKADWELPEYEVQRPAGAYLVDTAPVNTMVLAITRAGKGQTYIEPLLDMWSREKNPSNMVINDPKGELLVKNYIPFVTRGYEPVQFNLINAMKTDIYNPLGMAAEAAREGDSTKCALYVENIADVFFPLDGSEDPVWPNAANNAFKRAAYGLIDYYLEEERELREFAATVGMEPETLEQRLDDMWGHVTLYNCYQLFVQLTSKMIKNPEAELEKRVKAGEFDDDEEALQVEQEKAAKQAFLWEGKGEQDMLTLFFNATEALPTNTMRTLIGNANNALRAMAGAEKMLASVYGIAITAMSFFTDPTISTLTSGKPSQNTDLGGLSFPRRVGVRFSQNYLKRDHLIGQQAVWSAYADPLFTEPLGRDFDHSDIVTREGWARYYFKGKFPTDEAWLKLELVNPQTKMLVRTFYFQFRKNYQLSLNGRHYVVEPVTGKKIIKNGVIRELRPVREGGAPEGGTQSFEPAATTYPHSRLVPVGSGWEKRDSQARAITQTMVRYSEAPKAVFLVTPPHLQKYAKLILILVKQLVDLNFDKSYMTKSNQKPLYKTRFMLDELGNLQSDGNGISGFSTMLSIGLGQEQQFTLILQTLQQLRDVYGDSVDKIVQGNAQPMNALIATPDGWKKMGDMVVGDRVLTPFGTTTMVTGVYPKGLRPVYRVTLRDGSTTEACNEHLWAIERWKSSFRTENGVRIGMNSGKTAERVEEVIDTNELKRRIEKGHQIELPRIAPVDYPEADLPVDPYVLGAILGDGHVQPSSVVKFTCRDTEIVEEIRRRGYTVVDDTVRGERKDGIGYRINGVNKHLRDLGIAGKRSWEKSIPEAYLRGSVQQRIDLLRGLMDTDGTISKTGEMEFTSASYELAGNVQDLIRSLGGRVRVNVKHKVTYTAPNQVEPKVARPAYRVQNIRLPEINAFSLPRKTERWKDRIGSFGNHVVSVEYVRDDLVQCIRVADERHLYLTDDFIPTHNTSNIVFLKSTDDSMIETLEKMSGTTHKSRINSKQISQDLDKMIGGRTEGRVAYTMSTEKEPLISYNDMAFIPPRNSIVFRAGDAPVWNRNETILPMSWRLFKDKIIHPGHEYSLQTIPTLSSALEFDVRNNQPDFRKMLDRRMRQAVHAEDAKKSYQEAYGYREVDIERLDPDIYSDEVMGIITLMTAVDEGADPAAPMLVDPDEREVLSMYDEEDYLDNYAVAEEVHRREADDAEYRRLRYAEGSISREMLVNRDGSAKTHSLDIQIADAYKAVVADLEKDRGHFSIGADGELRSADGRATYISRAQSQAHADAVRKLNASAGDRHSRIYAESDLTESDLEQLSTVKVHGDFYRFLAALPSWEALADGRFERAMAIEMNRS